MPFDNVCMYVKSMQIFNSYNYHFLTKQTSSHACQTHGHYEIILFLPQTKIKIIDSNVCVQR